MFEQIDPITLNRRLAQTAPPRLLDVRTVDEFRRARLEGAVHIPLHELPSRMEELEPGEPLVVYCLSGGRSARACMFLAGRRFGRLANLSSGIVGWAQAGLPLVEGDHRG
jgi:rhodanese-related sulfurtransferase